MSTQQGSLALLNDPVAQRLLQSTISARFAYNWHDGTPRVVPIGFHWNGAEIVLGTPPDAPKMKALMIVPHCFYKPEQRRRRGTPTGEGLPICMKGRFYGL